MPDDQSPWVIKGVPEDVRRKVKVYAARHDISMAQAIAFLIDAAYANRDSRKTLWERGQEYLVRTTSRRPSDSEIVDLVAKASEINSLRQEGRPFDEYGLDMEVLKEVGLLNPVPTDY